jgi:hypothetical protein
MYAPTSHNEAVEKVFFVGLERYIQRIHNSLYTVYSSYSSIGGLIRQSQQDCIRSEPYGPPGFHSPRSLRSIPTPPSPTFGRHETLRVSLIVPPKRRKQPERYTP